MPLGDPVGVTRAYLKMARTLQDIVASVPPETQWKLDQEIDFEHKNSCGDLIPMDLGKIAESMVDWEDSIADCLFLTDAERYDINCTHPNNPKLRRREVLKKWKTRLGSAATYRALIEVFCNAGKIGYADGVCDLLKPPCDATAERAASSRAHAPTNTTAGHIDFSPSMNPTSLAKWLKQEYGTDYPEDVEKIIKAKIDGKLFLNISLWSDELKPSFGFKLKIKGISEGISSSAAPPRAIPPTTQPHLGADFDKYEVKNHFVSRLEWIDPVTGKRKCTRVYKKASSKWKSIAGCLGMELDDIDRIGHDHPFSDEDRVTSVFGEWFRNASKLENGKMYPKTWSGLIRLLEKSDLSELSTDVKSALSAPYSNVRHTISYDD